MKRVGLIAAVVLVLVVSQVQADPVPCSQGCRWHFAATGKVQSWHSRPRPAWHGETKAFGLAVDGVWIPSKVTGPCSSEFRGQGVTLRFNGCTTPTVIRLRWVSWNSERHKLLFYFRM